MTAQILNGKKLALLHQEKLKVKVKEFIAQGLRAPHLVVVLIGDNPASEIYVVNKVKACAKVGITSRLICFDVNISEEALLFAIAELNGDDQVDGILVQLPLPEHIDKQKVLLEIHPDKDVDGFHPFNMGLLTLKMSRLEPATPKGMMMLLDHYIGDIMGMNAVVVGASNIVGRPMLLELLNRRATVTICHSKTKDLSDVTSKADILVAAVGIPHFIKGKHVKKGAIVLDVGINRLADGKLVGDVDFDAVKSIAAWISPVPGGVGPMTIAGLLDNTVKTYESKQC